MMRSVRVHLWLRVFTSSFYRLRQGLYGGFLDYAAGSPLRS